MSERIRYHGRGSIKHSSLFEGESRTRRNFVDPTILAADNLRDGLGFLAAGGGFGLAAIGIGIGSFLYQKGRAEELRAKSGTNAEISRKQEEVKPLGRQKSTQDPS